MDHQTFYQGAQEAADFGPVDIEQELLVLPNLLDAAFVHEETRAWDALGAEHARLLVDGAHVRFIDSTGIGALIRLQKRLRARCCELLLVLPTEALWKALDRVKLTHLFAVADDWQEATTWGGTRAEAGTRVGASDREGEPCWVGACN